MTGTTDLSIEQLSALNRLIELDRDVNVPVRIVIHPAAAKAVRVELHSISFGDVVVGNRIITREGEIMTLAEAREHGC